MKYLYLISQLKRSGYDTYDSAVVCAESEEEARKMHPDGVTFWKVVEPNEGEWWVEFTHNREFISKPARCTDWADPKDVAVQLLGAATESVELGVVLASYNAG